MVSRNLQATLMTYGFDQSEANKGEKIAKSCQNKRTISLVKIWGKNVFFTSKNNVKNVQEKILEKLFQRGLTGKTFYGILNLVKMKV